MADHKIPADVLEALKEKGMLRDAARRRHAEAERELKTYTQTVLSMLGLDVNKPCSVDFAKGVIVAGEDEPKEKDENDA